jgi:hypothetical protein
MFVIEDELHAEPQGEFATYDEAVGELRRRARLPWDQEPNAAPCESWRTCGRRYEIIQYDTSSRPWKEIRRSPVLEISAAGVAWLTAPPDENKG